VPSEEEVKPILENQNKTGSWGKSYEVAPEEANADAEEEIIEGIDRVSTDLEIEVSSQ
jgi:hypothetical protein